MLCTLSRTYLNRFCLAATGERKRKKKKKTNCTKCTKCLARFIGNTYLFHIIDPDQTPQNVTSLLDLGCLTFIHQFSSTSICSKTGIFIVKDMFDNEIKCHDIYGK